MTMSPESVLDFWFGHYTEPFATPPAFQKWFRKDDDFDQEIRSRFGGLLEQAVRGELQGWEQSLRSRLALIVVLDQFSRNLFRLNPRAFAQDAHALRLTKTTIAAGEDSGLLPFERTFLYLPLEHSEDLEDQRASVQKFDQLLQVVPSTVRSEFAENLEYAIRHLEIIERFGRFPHRNAILGRVSTPEEVEFLKLPNSGF